MRKIVKQVGSKLVLGTIFLTAYMPNSVNAEDCELWIINCKTLIEDGIRKKALWGDLTAVCNDAAERAFKDKKARKDFEALCHRNWKSMKNSEDKPEAFCKIISLALINHNKCPK